MTICVRLVQVEEQFAAAVDGSHPDAPRIIAATAEEVRKLFAEAVDPKEEIIWLQPDEIYSVEPKPLI